MNIKFIVAFLIALCAPAAFAGYAQLSPPAGWAGSSSAGYSMPSASNSPTFNGGFMGPGGSANVGGKAVTMPAAYRFAANAGRFAATAMFRNPAWWAAATAIGYIADQCIGVSGGQWQITCNPDRPTCPAGATCYENVGFGKNGAYATPTAACNAWGSGVSTAGYTGVRMDVTTSPTSVICTMKGNDAGSITRTIATETLPIYRPGDPLPPPVPLSEPDFVERVSPQPIPADLPKVIPGPWPVLPPVLNPDPADITKPRPLYVPDGLPQAVPGSPGQFVQPAQKITPVPTILNPWQVNFEPVKLPTTEGEVTTEPWTPAEGDPAEVPRQPGEFPDDYNREVTQQEILKQLKAEEVADPANQEERVVAETAARKTELKDLFDSLPQSFAADKSNWFSWVWTPPVGECAPFSGEVRGFQVTWDMCPTVAMIREVLGWLFALFGAWQIYNLIFRGND